MRHARASRLAGIGLGCALAASVVSCSRPAPDLGTADYAALQLPVRCASADLDGPAGGSDRILTTHDIPFSVRTPANYDRARAHPLLVLYAPGGQHRFESERDYVLTRAATSAGFIVAYPDHLRLSIRGFEELGRVPALVAQRWCIDERRVYLAGHSDGGSTAAAVAFLKTSSLPPTALVISAAGIRKQDLDAYTCPLPLPVMVIHSRDDELFPVPAYGRDAAQWWASCNRCEPRLGPADANGCARFTGCEAGAPTVYCEITGSHAQWSSDHRGRLLAFLREW